MLTPGLGDLEPAGAFGFCRANQPLVLELRQRRVDRARAWSPEPLAPLFDRLHQLITIARLLGQQPQKREANVAPACPRPATAVRTPPRAAERAALPHPSQRNQV